MISREELLEDLNAWERGQNEFNPGNEDNHRKAKERIIECYDQENTELNLYGLKLRNLPESIGQLTNLQTLDLNDNQLVSLPESMGQLTNLQYLGLGGNQLVTLPDSIGQLTNLEELELRINQLANLPESIGGLTSLTTLGLGGNQLVTLPESIGELTSLQRLNLYNNRLVNLPESIGGLTRLGGLNLTYNRLVNLPESMGGLTRLKMLFLGNNLLVNLPESIGQLTNLQALFLENNQFVNLPESIGRLLNLYRLHLENNPLNAATRQYIDAHPHLHASYNMAAFEASPDSQIALTRIFPDEVEGKAVGSKIAAWAAEGHTSEHGANLETFLSRIQNSKFWQTPEFFEKYLQPTLGTMLREMDIANSTPNSVLLDLSKSGEGCSTNGTGTVLVHYMMHAIAKWKKDEGKEAMSYADIEKNAALKQDIMLIGLMEYFNALINEKNLPGDRAEIIADLLCIVSFTKTWAQNLASLLSRDQEVEEAYGEGVQDRASEINSLYSQIAIDRPDIVEELRLRLGDLKLPPGVEEREEEYLDRVLADFNRFFIDKDIKPEPEEEVTVPAAGAAEEEREESFKRDDSSSEPDEARAAAPRIEATAQERAADPIIETTAARAPVPWVERFASCFRRGTRVGIDPPSGGAEGSGTDTGRDR